MMQLFKTTVNCHSVLDSQLPTTTYIGRLPKPTYVEKSMSILCQIYVGLMSTAQRHSTITSLYVEHIDTQVESLWAPKIPPSPKLTAPFTPERDPPQMRSRRQSRHIDEVETLLCVHHMLSSEEYRRVQLLLVQHVAMLEWRRMMRTQHYLTNACLTPPNKSAWTLFYETATDINFLNITSLTRAAFEQLCDRFAQFYPIRRAQRQGGRPPKLQHHHDVLGLVLSFYVSSMEQKDLCKRFGVPPSTLARTLGKAEAALSKALDDYWPARIMWPSLGRQKRMARLVEAKEPLLKYTFGFIDGKNFKVKQPSNSDEQNAFYNGWLHAVVVTGTICFGADGCILWVKHNCPGSWNDSVTSSEFRDNLADPVLCPDQRYGVVADSAFPSSARMVGRILTPLKVGAIDRILPSRRQEALALHNAIVSIRQAAEWGVGSLEKVYHRLQVPLPYDPEKRRLRLMNIFHLSNFRVRVVGISQIRTTFRNEMEYQVDSGSQAGPTENTGTS